MSKAKKKPTRKPASRAKRKPEARAKPLWGILLLVVALLMIIALGDYHPSQDPKMYAPQAEPNATGAIGLYMATISRDLFGYAAWLLPVVLGWTALMLFLKHERKPSWIRYVLVYLALVAGPVAFTIYETERITPDKVEITVTDEGDEVEQRIWMQNGLKNGRGGLVGTTLYRGLLEQSLGLAGTSVITGVLLALSYIYLFTGNPVKAFSVYLEHRRNLVAKRSRKLQEKKEKAQAKALENARNKAKQVTGKSAGQKPAMAAGRSGKSPAGPRLAPPPALGSSSKKAPAQESETSPQSGMPPPPSGLKKPASAALPKKKPGPNLKLSSSKSNKAKDEDLGDGGLREPVAGKDKPLIEEPEPPVDDKPAKLTLKMFGLKPKDKPAPQVSDNVDEPEEDTPTEVTDPSTESPAKEEESSINIQKGKRKMVSGSAAAPVNKDERVEERPSGLKIITAEEPRKARQPRLERAGDYMFPPIDLLPEQFDDDEEEEDYEATAETLVRILDEFNVKVTMGEVHRGPVITRYDIHPAPGVRVEKIVNLDKNIAMGLQAMSVRILAPVPGKGCVGIEIPNRKPQSVRLREILDSENWANTKAKIPVVLGKEVSGRPLIADLAKMPHLLIAGSTGSGKTVCINTIISSLCYHASPDDLKFVMVDPKIVEMQGYNTLPHMLIPVVTEAKKVPNALRYLINEMENRYQIFAKLGVRNITGFNAKRAKDAQAEKEAAMLEASLSPEERAAVASIEVPRDLEVEIPEKMPYIVCIIDELADLMMVSPADVETGIARLAQLARAAGIHLIIATQRPSVNVITGVIKANLPSRIAFKVASKVDSRTILDVGGADQLIGKGDMLFLPPGTADLIRAQGAFVSDDEINQVVNYLTKKNGEPEYDENFQKSVEEGVSEGEGKSGEAEDDEDPLISQAIDVLRSTKRASTSMLQRRLRIGYNRAARIMDILEDREIVGPENGSSPREILKDLDSL